VVQNPNGLLGLKTDDLIPYTVAAIQELNLNLEDIAGTTTPIPGTDADTFVTVFFKNIENKIGAWLADAGNGVTDIFAGNIHAKKELCINNTCVTEAQLQQLLQNAQNANGTASVLAPVAPTPDPVIAPAPAIDPVVPTITPDPTPVVDPIPDPTDSASSPQASPAIDSSTPNQSSSNSDGTLGSSTSDAGQASDSTTSGAAQ
jgi:hypothetical protein